ncbi:MAG: DUF5320 domain-containing protein [Proteobacteria bacterium]|jgi:hypothetical protein|nr:DUF5320 domain-containing protein [Pseudomonadota bacterium]
MPNSDRSGPRGDGPRTGHGMGKCKDNNQRRRRRRQRGRQGLNEETPAISAEQKRKLFQQGGPSGVVSPTDFWGSEKE